MSAVIAEAGVMTRDALLAEVASWEARIAEWENEATAAVRQREQLAATMGDRVLDNPDSADEVSQEYTKAVAGRELAQRAIEAAQPRLDRARRAVLEFDADAIAGELAEARRDLEAHEDKKARLLAALIKHDGEGEFVRHGAVEHAAWVAKQPATESFQVYRNKDAQPWVSDGLRSRVLHLELREGVLRDVAAGVDPSSRFAGHVHLAHGNELWDGRKVSDFYPPTVRGPEALIEAPRFVPPGYVS